MFRFKCHTCDEWHEGMPSFATDAPFRYYSIPDPERKRRCKLTTDTCVIDKGHFFVRGCIEIPVHGETDPFVWGAWISLTPENFKRFRGTLWKRRRAHLGPLFGWLSVGFDIYPDTGDLKTVLHLRDDGLRPLIELEPTDHPLAVEQRMGISIDRVAEIYARYMHPEEAD